MLKTKATDGNIIIKKLRFKSHHH